MMNRAYSQLDIDAGNHSNYRKHRAGCHSSLAIRETACTKESYDKKPI